MSLILALFLIIILLCRIGADKSKSAEYDRRKSERDKIVSDWKSNYVDLDLETRLKRCIADEHNYDAVIEEISGVLSSMEHWKYLLDCGFPLNGSQVFGKPNYKQAIKAMQTNQGIALDIMLANRGKVSSMASAFGYDAYVHYGDKRLMESRYEYAKTILNLMHANSKPVKLYYYLEYGSDAYYWDGTHPNHRTDRSKGKVLLPFDENILFKENPIPPLTTGK